MKKTLYANFTSVHGYFSVVDLDGVDRVENPDQSCKKCIPSDDNYFKCLESFI